MFYYNDYRGKHNITLKRACPEWINADTPDIYFEDESLLWHSDISGVTDLPLWAIKDGTGEKLIKFILKSDNAFRKKYPDSKTVVPFEKTFLGSWINDLKKMIERGY